MIMDYKITPGKYYENSSTRQWYAERNKQIYKDKLAGMSNAEIVTKYQISTARVLTIVRKERAKNDRNTSNVA